MDKEYGNRPFYPVITEESEQYKKDWGYDTEKDRGGSFQKPNEKIDKGILQVK